MPDEIIEDQIEDSQVVDENLEQDKEVQEPESRETVIEKIKNKISDFMGGGSTEDEAGEEIPDDFSSAAQDLGWSDEDIAEFADGYTNEELLEMIPVLAPETSEESEDTGETADDTQQEENQGEDSHEDEKIQKLLARIDALEKAQGDVNKQKEQQELQNRAQRASKMFDELSDKFEVFGKTEELPKFPDGRPIPNSPQLKARNEVWNVAHDLMDTGMDFDQAMEISFNAFKGKNLASDVKRNIIKDLKKNESRLSGKHTSHESQITHEYGPDVIKEVARRHGREIR